MYLFDYQLTELPKEIGNLTNLTELNIGCNELTKLPKEIGNLTNLTNLNLSLNKLTELPKEIGNLTNLNVLDLSENELTELPKEIWMLKNLSRIQIDFRGNLNVFLNLKNLNLKNLNLTEIPSFITQFKNLEILDISYNKLTKLNPAIAESIMLKKINMEGNRELNEIPDFLWELPNLKEIIIDSKLYFSIPENISNIDPIFLETIKSLLIASKNKLPMKDSEIMKAIGIYRILLKKKILSLQID